MAAVDYFLKIDGVDGESTDDKHKGEIDILSWSWGVQQSGTMAHGGGGGEGKLLNRRPRMPAPCLVVPSSGPQAD